MRWGPHGVGRDRHGFQDREHLDARRKASRAPPPPAPPRAESTTAGERGYSSPQRASARAYSSSSSADRRQRCGGDEAGLLDVFQQIDLAGAKHRRLATDKTTAEARSVESCLIIHDGPFGGWPQFARLLTRHNGKTRFSERVPVRPGQGTTHGRIDWPGPEAQAARNPCPAAQTPDQDRADQKAAGPAAARKPVMSVARTSAPPDRTSTVCPFSTRASVTRE